MLYYRELEEMKNIFCYYYSAKNNKKTCKNVQKHKNDKHF